MYLESLFYLIEVDASVPVLDYKGKRDGELHVKLNIVAEDDDREILLEDGLPPDSLEDLIGSPSQPLIAEALRVLIVLSTAEQESQ